jgi:hypothetical protein
MELELLQQNRQFIFTIQQGELTAGTCRQTGYGKPQLSHTRAPSIPASSALLNTGPSTQHKRVPTAQCPHLPTPHFMRRSRER